MLAQLDRVKAELWAAWRQSQIAQEITSTEKTGAHSDRGITPTKIRHLVRQQTKASDVSYMNAIVTCLREEAKVLGLYAEETAGGQSINLTESQLSAISTLMGECREPN